VCCEETATGKRGDMHPFAPRSPGEAANCTTRHGAVAADVKRLLAEGNAEVLRSLERWNRGDIALRQRGAMHAATGRLRREKAIAVSPRARLATAPADTAVTSEAAAERDQRDQRGSLKSAAGERVSDATRLRRERPVASKAAALSTASAGASGGGAGAGVIDPFGPETPEGHFAELGIPATAGVVPGRKGRSMVPGGRQRRLSGSGGGDGGGGSGGESSDRHLGDGSGRRFLLERDPAAVAVLDTWALTPPESCGAYEDWVHHPRLAFGHIEAWMRTILGCPCSL